LTESYTAKEILRLHQNEECPSWAIESLASLLDVSTPRDIAVMRSIDFSRIEFELIRQGRIPGRQVTFPRDMTLHHDGWGMDVFSLIIFPIWKDQHWSVAAIVKTMLPTGGSKRNVLLFDSSVVVFEANNDPNTRNSMIGYALCSYANYISGGWNRRETAAFDYSPGKQFKEATERNNQ